MPDWTYFGRVLPERVPLTLPAGLSSDHLAVGLDIEFTTRISIHASQVIVHVSLKREDVDVETIKNLAEAEVRRIADLIGYLRGISFDVEILSAVSHDTEDWRVFGIEIPALAERRKEEYILIDTDLLKATGDPCTQLILADFREAMRLPVLTGFFCYRCIEAMMQSMKTSDKEKDSSGWERLRHSLRADRSPIDFLKSHSDLPRHGRISAISDRDRGVVFTLTDELISRYLAYVRSSRVPLTDTFPIMRHP